MSWNILEIPEECLEFRISNMTPARDPYLFSFGGDLLERSRAHLAEFTSWGNLAGNIWSHLETSGVIWSHPESCGGIWGHLEASGIIWRHLESCGIM